MIHKCNKCEYQTPYKSNYGRHLKNKHEEYILPTHPDNIPNKMIHRCVFCNYTSNHKWVVRRHIKSKHQEPTILRHSNYKSLYNSSHMNTAHTPQQTMLHSCCTSKDECGTRRHDMTGDQVRTLINNSFDVFQNYMKMQATEDGNEDMVENITDIFKYYMLKKINE